MKANELTSLNENINLNKKINFCYKEELSLGRKQGEDSETHIKNGLMCMRFCSQTMEKYAIKKCMLGYSI